MRILVCGGRDIHDYWYIKSWLEHYDVNDLKDKNILITGGAAGTDTLAHRFGKQFAMKQEVYKADWEKYGRRAGPIRNQQMLDEGKPDLVIAFPGGKGTADMVRRTILAGIKVIEIENNT